MTSNTDIKKFVKLVTSGQEVVLENHYTTQELIAAVNSLSDAEIFELSTKRPGYPAMRGFIVNPRLLSRAQTAAISSALMQRLTKNQSD